MSELWFEIAENPAYRHVLLNHLPITGLAIAACALAWAMVENRWRSMILGLSLCLVTSASAVLVMQSGDAAYPFIFDQIGGTGQTWLDHHVELAERWGRLLPANAVLAAIALATGSRYASCRRRMSGLVLITTAFSLAAAGVIAQAGGHIRHPEFRTAHAPAGAGTERGSDRSAGLTPLPAKSQPATLAMRRLTKAQYRNVMSDVFGPGIELAGRFEPENRRNGLIAVGSAQATITASGFEQYEGMASEVARQALLPERRKDWLPCIPSNAEAADPACSKAILEEVGPLLLRRPLRESEIRARAALADQAATEFGNFYTGIASTLSSLLVAPEFLFRLESTVPETAQTIYPVRLSDATLASRLSFLLWNSGPDNELLEAVRRGDLHEQGVYAKQVDRLLSSPRLEQGIRALFEDIFQFDEFENLSKDPIRYPMFSARVAADAREQTLRTVVDHLLSREGSYLELFTTPHTFMTRILGPVYALPVRTENGWEELKFPPSSGRGGILSHASFNMLNAHSGRSSPTLRGLFVREALLCQHVPPAPADVDFGLFNADDSPEHKTARNRLEVHASNATCRNCHTLTDPLGLGLEPFDGMGRFRRTENDAPIDASGDLDGKTFRDPASLGIAMAKNDRVAGCLAERTYQYAIGRTTTFSERAFLRRLEDAFDQGGHRITHLMREIVNADGFQRATAGNSMPAEDWALREGPS